MSVLGTHQILSGRGTYAVGLSPAQAQSFDKNKCMELKKFEMF